MSESNQIEYTLAISTERSDSSVKKLEGSIIRCLGYATQLAGGDSDIQRGIRKGMEVAADATITFRSATIAANAFKLAAGPISWIYFGTTALATGITFGHMMTDIGE